MDNVISEYQKWKQHGESLRTQAKQAMETSFRDLLLQAARIAEEYRSDFGATLKPPPSITTFRYKTGARAGTRSKKVAKAAEPKSAVPKAVASKAADPKVVALEKRLAQTRSKLEAAKAAGKPTKNLEDRIYELEDDLRLSGQTA
jgi:hypothetical protein